MVAAFRPVETWAGEWSGSGCRSEGDEVKVEVFREPRSGDRSWMKVRIEYRDLYEAIGDRDAETSSKVVVTRPPTPQPRDFRGASGNSEGGSNARSCSTSRAACSPARWTARPRPLRSRRTRPASSRTSRCSLAVGEVTLTARASSVSDAPGRSIERHEHCCATRVSDARASNTIDDVICQT